MADTKISALPSASTPLTGTEVLPIVQGAANFKVAVSDLTAGRALSATAITLTSGTANGVAYLNGSKVLTTGSALTFDGSKVAIATAGNDQLTWTSGKTGYLYADSAGIGIGDTALLSGNATYYNKSSNYIANYINGSEQMRLTSSGLEVKQSQLIGYSSYAGIGTNGLAVAGNVGIGTSSPIAKLDVGGALTDTVPATYGGTIRVNSATQTTTQAVGGIEFPVAGDGYGYKLQQISNNGANLVFASRSGSAAWTNRMTLDYAGNLGLGASPSTWATLSKGLEVGTYGAVSSNSSTGGAYLSNNAYLSTNNDTTGWVYETTNGATLYKQGLGFHQWSIAGSGTADAAITFTQAMTLDASGNLLVGTTSGGPIYGTEKLVVAGPVSIKTTGNSGYGVWLNSGSATTGTALQIYNGSTPTQVGSISITATNAAYNTSSDYRLKNITGPITTSGAYIDSLKPVEGTWKADGSTFVGLIAHETQEVSRTTVATGTKDGAEMQGMDYSSAEIIANLIAEIQDLRKRLAAAGI